MTQSVAKLKTRCSELEEKLKECHETISLMRAKHIEMENEVKDRYQQLHEKYEMSKK